MKPLFFSYTYQLALISLKLFHYHVTLSVRHDATPPVAEIGAHTDVVFTGGDKKKKKRTSVEIKERCAKTMMESEEL